MTLSNFNGITWPDYLVIALYFIFVLGVGLYSSWKSKRDSIGGYFLASRSMHFIPVGASLFASNIGSGHFIGLAGTGAASGIAISAFELSAIFFILMLGWWFVPVYMSSQVYTMPEYLRLRFGGQRIRVYLSVLTLLLYVFTKISADLYAGALFITQATQTQGHPEAIYISILILLVIASIFTVAGGLSAVIWTDFVQTVLMVVGALVVCVQSFVSTGGYHMLIERYFNATADLTKRAFKIPGDPESGLCGDVDPDAMHLFRDNNSDLPWTGIIFGLSISSIWYWCTDQVIVQRTLAAKNMTHAKGGCVLAGWLKLLPLWLMVFPGMASRALFPNVVACASPETCLATCQSASGCTNLAFVKLVNELLPAGVRGIMLAVMMAALMSSLSSIFNSSSTIFTLDIYTRFRPKAGETELLVAGRAFIIFLVVISVVWIPILQAAQGSQLFVYIQSITSYLAPPICAVYLLAVFWPRTNEPGAFWGLMGGLVIGLIRFGLEYSYNEPACGSSDEKPPEWWYTYVKNIHFLNFGVILWVISGLITVIVSILTPAINEDYLHRLTFWSRKSAKVRQTLENEDEDGTEKNTETRRLVKSTQDEIPSWKKTLKLVCCVGENKAAAEMEDPSYAQSEQKSQSELAREAAEFLDEPQAWRRFVNGQAVALMTVTCFVWGFYA